jgi:hypothetical protein
MAYTINKFSGIPFITVEDGTADTTTDLTLVGKNYTGYGEIQNENFLFLLESFAGEVQPTNGITGQVWYDTLSEKIKVYDGVTWKATGGAETSSTTPVGLAEGDGWWDTSTNQFKILNSSGEWVLVGPQRAGSGTTQLLSVEIAEASTGALFACIASIIGDKIVAIQSKEEFIPATTQDIDNWVSGDFLLIKSGFTISGVDADGISQIDSTGETNIYYGTAGTALKLTDGTNVFGPSDFLPANAALVLNNIAKFPDAGFTVGNNDVLTTYVTSDIPHIKLNNLSNELRIVDNAGNTAYVITGETIRPAVNNTKTLGTASFKWNNVHATTFTGIATQADTLKETNSAQYRTASTSSVANTVAVRDSNADLFARLFSGTATQARYADLAEKYSTAEDLPAGTAVAVSYNDDAEVHPASASDLCIGVVSTDPAYMMNSEAEGQYIGLKGRLPVRVKGAVKKGQAVYAMAEGVCTTIATTSLVGVALETDLSEGEKLVECVLKV